MLAVPLPASSTVGIVKVNRAPMPGPSLSAHIRPPCASTQARPEDTASAFVPLDTGELPKQEGQELGGYAPAFVGDRDRNVKALPHGGHRDDGRLRGVPGGVGQQVAQDLHDAQPVRHDQGQVGFDLDGEGCSCPLS